MTPPNDSPREPAIDPSDPRWVEDILERARRRAEEGRSGLDRDPVGAPAPVRPSAPAAPLANAAPAPTPAAPATGAPDRPATPEAGPSAPPAGDSRPAPRRIEMQPLGDAAPAATPNPRPRPAAAAAPSGRARPDATAGPAIERDATRVAPTAAAADATVAGPLFDRDALFDTPGEGSEDADAEPAGGIDRRMRSWLEWGGVIVGALLVAFVIRAVAFQAFYIPSESMESTLLVKDRILVNKLSYKLHDVNRGDIVVFEKPPGETSKINDLIKRVIALPGETIEQQGSDIYIDRGQGPQKLTEGYVNDPSDIGAAIAWVQGCANPSTETTKCTIPEGHVWVMGDNRGHSHDSRAFGPIDEDLIVGRAFVKVWPLNKLGFL